MKELKYYKTKNNKIPFLDWLNKLKDKLIIKKIFSRLISILAGILGDHHSVGEGVQELRFRNWIRIYYGEEKQTIIILLLGGNKGSQQKDIELAKQYWKEHKNNFGGN